MTARRGHIAGLDGLRALSIALVMIGHAYGTLPDHTRTSDALIALFGNASLGVTTFFVISGYLITRLLRDEGEAAGSISLRGFYLRRALRIFPAFYLYIAVIVLLAALGVVATSAKSIAAAATFSLNYSELWDPGEQATKHFWFVGHFWTLALEEQFYLLWPLTLTLLGLRRAGRVAVILLWVCPVLRVLTYFFWPAGRTLTALMLPTAADSLMAGGALALAEGGSRFEALVAQIPLRTAALAALLLAFLVSPILRARFAGAYDLPLGRTVNAGAMAVTILYVTRYPDSWLGRVLNSRFAVFVGVLSYSLYLWQQPFLTPWNTTWSGRFPLNIFMSLGAALLSYHLVEKPFLRLKKRIRGNPGLCPAPLPP